MLDEYREMLQSSDYEVGLYLDDKTAIGKFPKKIQPPSSEAYTVEYDLNLYPKYVIYHLIMGDMIQRCQSLQYDLSLIGLYYKNKQVSQESFCQCIKMDNEDKIKHNTLGLLLQSSLSFGLTADNVAQAKECGVFEYLVLLMNISGAYNE
jgi:hypothetical protein